MTTYFLGGYWSSRRESIVACARRSRDFFGALSQLGKPFSKWYERGMTRKAALTRRARVDDVNYWKARLDHGRHRTDIGNKVMRDLGFSFGLWNGGPDTAACGVHIHCGDYTGRITNFATMNIHAEDIHSRIMLDVLRLTAATWQPDWAGVMSTAAMDRRNYNASRPFVDWMTYVSDEWLPDTPELKAPSTVERLPNGTLIVVQETPPDVDDLAHQRNIRRVQRALRSRLTVGTS